MAATIGIPQSLLYYKYYPLWNTLLEGLGAEVAVSTQTSKRTINAGTALAENELCMPVKVFFGHVDDLKERVDAIFVPRVVSVEKSGYTCPKFLGLPDLARSVDPHLPLILDPVFNARLKKRHFYESLFEFGRFFTTSKTRVLKAWHAATIAQKQYQQQLEAGLTPNEIITGATAPTHTGELTIGIAGHAYNIYDPYTSLNIISKLRSWGVNVVTTDMVSPHKLEHAATRLPKRLFWSYEKEVVGSAFHWLKTREVDGIIYILSFACGPDSLIQVLLETEAKKQGSLPLMSLVVDEHSGEAGMITRVEAFIDMLKWRALA